MEKRGYLDISFGWMFAIMAGVIILAFAFFMAQKFIGLKNNEIDTASSKELGTLLNPFEIGIESGSSNFIETPSRSRLDFECDDYGNFGSQSISTAHESLGKFSEQSDSVSFQNKYIFSEKEIEGKKFYLFIMPFDYPYKVADMIIITSEDDEFCFVDPPSEIKSDLRRLSQDNFKINPDCSSKAKRICFSSDRNCDVVVKYDQGYVVKDGEELYFDGNLIYGAVFSDKDYYECQIKRLMKRMEQLNTIYEKKAIFLNLRGCQNNMAPDLGTLGISVSTYSSSRSLSQMSMQVKELEVKNGNSGICGLW
ncbi:hypothetical protein COU57_03990 [Candidatus Pacearchaeota archaeon CG10_big_fil_rev_8_21_14_0_10_32_14]|nr:MAG: hypothetical protein COU57_03990 [Candidatus Pacearchaeota archaeon CG10_big_fil_rev_8_21_14_0_10_32_14]